MLDTVDASRFDQALIAVELKMSAARAARNARESCPSVDRTASMRRLAHSLNREASRPITKCILDRGSYTPIGSCSTALGDHASGSGGKNPSLESILRPSCDPGRSIVMSKTHHARARGNVQSSTEDQAMSNAFAVLNRLSASPESLASWCFCVERHAGAVVAQLSVASPLDDGLIKLAEGQTYIVVSRPGIGPFVLESKDGHVSAHACALSKFGFGFSIEHRDRNYRLEKTGQFCRELELITEGTRVGRVSGPCWFSRRIEAEISSTEPALLQLFVVYLALALWRLDWEAYAW